MFALLNAQINYIYKVIALVLLINGILIGFHNLELMNLWFTLFANDEQGLHIVYFEYCDQYYIQTYIW